MDFKIIDENNMSKKIFFLQNKKYKNNFKKHFQTKPINSICITLNPKLPLFRVYVFLLI